MVDRLRVYKVAAGGVLVFSALTGWVKYRGNSSPHVEEIDKIFEVSTQNTIEKYLSCLFVDSVSFVGKKFSLNMRAVTKTESVSNSQIYVGDRESFERFYQEFSNIWKERNNLAVFQFDLDEYYNGVFMNMEFYWNSYMKDVTQRFVIADPNNLYVFSYDYDDGWSGHAIGGADEKLTASEVDRLITRYAPLVP